MEFHGGSHSKVSDLLDTCKTVWDHLVLMYSNNVSQIYDMTVEYYGLKQGDSDLT